MRIRVFLPNFTGQKSIILSADQFHHIIRVLRAQLQDEVFVFNHSGEWMAKIGDIDHKKNICALQIIKKISSIEMPKVRAITLFCPIIKPRAMKEAIEMATEIGVEAIYPIITQHAPTTNCQLEKLRLVSIGSSEQCGRMAPPQIYAPQPIINAVHNFFSNENQLYFGHIDCSINKITNNDINNNGIGCLVGPEGGLCREEVDFLLNSGAIPIKLGKNILRTETAVVAILAKFI